MDMTTIGILGSGHVGSNLAKAAIAHGYDVVLSNTQGPDSLAGLVKELGPLAGKVVIATVNYFPQRYGHVPGIDGTTTAPGLLQAHLPASRVVRAFSMINADEMSGDGHPQGDPRRRALALAGDDPAAKQLVAGLYEEFGFDPVDIGDLDESWRVDAGQPAFVTRQNVAELTANVAKAKRGA
jgi:8-hydroxy-5-deazaflavin:NADPH oxidoreductase